MTVETKQEKCPYCESSDLTKKKRGWTITTGIFGMNQMQYQCHECGKKFMEKKANFD
ncbi:hypothetical protein ACERJO_13250 [Halalkalibacter sp. AB-rgal2]|uniref:hypothetical protein n=1 Tax=Halalkalibacter sp. AB-rgal2 TaxID=3242695 RepID=UPI00359D4C9B